AAAAGLGVWAPVTGQIGWQIYVFVAAFSSAHLVLQPRLEPVIAKRMLTFGFGVTASLRIWHLRGLTNSLLVARFAGAEGAAFVALALRIAEALGSLRLAAGRIAIATL